uniref:V-type proton ATPase subunit D n=1 Tax=Glossina pallidipes TaxID=7398 RepID=A0A1A9ZJI3_GLOPL
MAQRDRINLFPSRANMVSMKQRVASAVKGLSLLKRKRDALELFLREMSAELEKNSAQMDAAMREAIFSLAKANFLNTDFKPAAVVNPDRADAYIRVKQNKIIGTSVPQLQLVLRTTTAAIPFTGLATGGRQVEETRLKFQEALKIIVAVASLKYNVKILRESVHTTNMRVNGLDYVVIPRFQNTANYIRDELDELEREDFYRLKRSQAKQLKKKKSTVVRRGKNEEQSDEEVEAPKKNKTKARPEVRIMDYGESRAATTRSTMHSLGAADLPAAKLSRYVSFIKGRNTVVLESGEVPALTGLEKEPTVEQEYEKQSSERKQITSSESSLDTLTSETDGGKQQKFDVKAATRQHLREMFIKRFNLDILYLGIDNNFVLLSGSPPNSFPLFVISRPRDVVP